MVIWIAEEPLSLSGKEDIDKDEFKVAEVGDGEIDIGVLYCDRADIVDGGSDGGCIVDIVSLNIVDAGLLLLIMIDHDDKDEFKIAEVGDGEIDIGVLYCDRADIVDGGSDDGCIVDIVFLNIVDAGLLLLIMIDHDDKDEFKIAEVGDGEIDIGVLYCDRADIVDGGSDDGCIVDIVFLNIVDAGLLLLIMIDHDDKDEFKIAEVGDGEIDFGVLYCDRADIVDGGSDDGCIVDIVFLNIVDAGLLLLIMIDIGVLYCDRADIVDGGSDDGCIVDIVFLNIVDAGLLLLIMIDHDDKDEFKIAEVGDGEIDFGVLYCDRADIVDGGSDDGCIVDIVFLNIVDAGLLLLIMIDHDDKDEFKIAEVGDGEIDFGVLYCDRADIVDGDSDDGCIVDIVFLNIVDAGLLLLIMIDHDDKDEFKIAEVGDGEIDIGVLYCDRADIVDGGSDDGCIVDIVFLNIVDAGLLLLIMIDHDDKDEFKIAEVGDGEIDIGVLYCDRADIVDGGSDDGC